MMKLGKDKAKTSDPATAEEEEEAAFAKAVADVRCLHILRALLERISGVRPAAPLSTSPCAAPFCVAPTDSWNMCSLHSTDPQRQLCTPRPPARAHYSSGP